MMGRSAKQCRGKYNCEYVCVFMYVCMCLCVYELCSCIYLFMCVRMNYVYVCIYMSTYLSRYIHSYIHTKMLYTLWEETIPIKRNVSLIRRYSMI